MATFKTSLSFYGSISNIQSRPKSRYIVSHKNNEELKKLCIPYYEIPSMNKSVKGLNAFKPKIYMKYKLMNINLLKYPSYNWRRVVKTSLSLNADNKVMKKYKNITSKIIEIGAQKMRKEANELGKHFGNTNKMFKRKYKEKNKAYESVLLKTLRKSFYYKERVYDCDL